MLNSPLFINMTRWAAAYGGPGARFGAAQVDQTADQVGAALGVGMGLLPRLRPANNASNDLDYITAPNRLACNLGPALFARAVGSSGGVAGNNGQTNLTELRCAMNSAWPALPHPTLAVIDSDAAHHVSLLLAERAFVNVAAGHARIVINFDAHTDYAAAVPNLASLRCDNWGSFTVRPVPPVYLNPIADAYVMIGNKTAGLAAPNPLWGNTTARFRQPVPAAVPGMAAPVAPAPPSVPVAGATIALQMANMINQLNGMAAALNGGPWAGYAVYVTVDRDVQQSSFTDYGDGAYPVATVWQAVDDCLTALDLAGAAFTGFDVCGLPTYAGGSVASGGMPPIARNALACADIVTFEGFIANL